MTYFDYSGHVYWHMENIINQCKLIGKGRKRVGCQNHFSNRYMMIVVLVYELVDINYLLNMAQFYSLFLI